MGSQKSKKKRTSTIAIEVGRLTTEGSPPRGSHSYAIRYDK